MTPGLAILLAAWAGTQPGQWRLVEEWRVGGEVEGPHSFGDVRGLGILPGGGIVLLDAKDQQVHYLDARGRPVRTVGRKGAGPGEFQRANGLLVSPTGVVIVNDPGNSRFTLLSATGELVRTVLILNPWGFGFLWDASLTTGGLVDEYVPVRKGNQNTTVSARQVWSADFSRADTLIPPDCPGPAADPTDRFYTFRSERASRTMSIPFRIPRTVETRAKDGTRWAGRHPDYDTIERFPSSRCESDLAIRLSGPRIRIRTALRDSMVEQVRTSASSYGAPVPDLEKIPRDYRPYDALFLDGLGRLWIERWVSETARRFEVYGPTGRLLAEVASPVAFRSYRPVIITNDRVLGFVPDEDDVLHLASFRIVR